MANIKSAKKRALAKTLRVRKKIFVKRGRKKVKSLSAEEIEGFEKFMEEVERRAHEADTREASIAYGVSDTRPPPQPPWKRGRKV